MNTPPYKYWAFISYSHRDAAVARTLQRTLEAYRLPKRLVGRRTTAGEVPARLKPVFLDREELQAGTDLKKIVGEALAQSRYLIVVCSPDAARSPWVEQEIIEFKKTHGESRVLAVIASGEPFASRLPGREAEECFPLPLRAELTSSGLADGPALEPIAADFRTHADGRHRGTLKLIAGIVGVGADDLIRRDARRRMRQLALLAAGSLAGMAAMGVLAISAVQSRNDAQRQRGEAEVLLEFMLGDLRKKLVPVGRLEVLDGVGEKALEYYARQDPDRLDANALGRRSRALHLIGELREQRGQLDAAQLAFDRAADTTAQLLARAPQDGQRIFDHAQSVYWVGHLAWLRGDAPAAESAFRHYGEFADQLVRLAPANLEWQAERAYAHVNIGVVCNDTARAAEALDHFAQARATWLRLIPTQPARAGDLANCLGWIAKAYESQGDFERAAQSQHEKMRALATLPDAATNQMVKRQLRVVYNELARLELIQGRLAEARQFALKALDAANALTASDPRNTTWLEQKYISQVIVAEVLFATGDRAAARENSLAALAGATKLLATDPKIVSWQVNLRTVVLCMAAKVAEPPERRGLINSFNDCLAKVRQYSTSDRGATQVRDVLIAKTESQLALLLDREGRRDDATRHWQAVKARLSPYAGRNDFHALTWLAIAQFHLDAIVEARALAQRIESSPFRHPDFAELKRMLADGSGLSLVKP